MRYRELIEAPIADLQIVNKDTDKYYNDFDKSDEGILNSQKGVQKIMNAFAKTPFDFNIYVIMRPTEGIWGQSFDQTQADAKEFLKDQIGGVQTDGRITCVYLSNVTGRSNRMPMNAWTIAHRMIHMMQTSTSSHDAKFDILHFERTLWENLVKIASLSTNMQPRFLGSMLQMASPEKAMVQFANCIMTQKSARDGRISNSLDVGGEALAQYLLTGAIRYNQFDTIVENHAKLDGLVGKPSFDMVRGADKGKINKMIYAAENESMVACRDTLQTMVGNVYWF